MEQRESNKRAQFRGFLFELVIGKLLERNNFHRIITNTQPKNRFREKRVGFIEIKGRGSWHQIDCPYDYDNSIPFSYPLRLLGEVKFYKDKIGKEQIRELIGTLKDIQENYFTVEGKSIEKHYPRMLEFGVFFAANGFNKEAERLAYAHGIKTLSYSNNPLIERIKDNIYKLSEDYYLPEAANKDMYHDLRYALQYNYYHHNYHDFRFFKHGFEFLFDEILHDLLPIQTSFIGSTITGIFIHFLGRTEFPFELFKRTDYASCEIYYDTNKPNTKYFKLVFSEDEARREFYFTPPSSLNRATSFGSVSAIRMKEVHFSRLFVTIFDPNSNISRQLILNLNRDWYNAVYKLAQESN